ncbi:hypothetical protein [Streptomyces sp. NPDC048737]|uniref:hypothetical protein n=1 Tax=unclassified Streptomyces TaxID=2593676 RepID=UPI00343FB6B3
MAAFSYLFLTVAEAQAGGSPQSGARWAGALQGAVPAAAVELGITVVVLLWARAMSTDPASGTARAVAIAVASVCASLPAAFFVGLAAWPLVWLSSLVPAALAAPVFLRSAAATPPPA